MPSSTAEELQNVLASEAAAYQRLVELTQCERTALQVGTLVELAATIRDKEAILESLARLEQTRERITAQLSQELKLPAEVSLPDLITRLSEVSLNANGAVEGNGIAHKWIALRREFINLVEQLITLNQGNRLLIQAELACVDATFDYLGRINAAPDGQYTARGNSHAQPAAGNVLNWTG